MGSLAGQSQREEVKAQVNKLLATSKIVYGSLEGVNVVDADSTRGAFLSPLVLLNENPFSSREPHEVEAFGPVSTIMPYRNMDEAIELSKKGKGSLCSSIVTADPSHARQYVLGAASHHGRILVLNNECAKESTGHGSPLPLLVHGGPGRAGAEKNGRLKGCQALPAKNGHSGFPFNDHRYQRRVPAACPRDQRQQTSFKQYFEDLRIGEQIITDKRLITSDDIDAFADLSGDHFYAHIKTTDFNGTMFEQQVAHGYFIAERRGRIVCRRYEKNPVLLNYGIDELRFTKPIYPGNSIYIRFTCKEKTAQELKEPNPDVPAMPDPTYQGVLLNGMWRF